MFREGSVEVEGGKIRVLDGGEGPPLVHLADAGALRVTAVHDLLCRRFRVIIVETPAGPSPETALARAVTSLGLDAFNLWSTSRGAATALRLALRAPPRVLALALEAPTALGPDARDEDLEEALRGLAVPTLVLLGTTDAVVPPAAGRAWKALLPDAHLVFVYAAGHAIGADRPEAFAEVVADFLERHEAFVVSRTPTVIHP